MLPIRLIYVSNILGENRPLSPIIEPLELGDLEFFSPLTVWWLCYENKILCGADINVRIYDMVEDFFLC
jgi:hypothetical protein